MPKQSNNNLVLGGVAVLVIAAAVWFFVGSGNAGSTDSPTRQPTVTMTDDEPAEPVGRSEPQGSTGGARLEGVAAAVEEEDDEGVTQKSKTKRSKQRQRRTQEREKEEEKEESAKKGKKDRVFGK